MSSFVRPLRRTLRRRPARPPHPRRPTGQAGLAPAPISSGFRYPVHRTALGPVRPILLLIIVGATVVAALLWSAGEQMLSQARADALAAATRENANRAIAYQQFVARTLDSARLAIDHYADRFATLAPATGPAAPPRRLEDPIAGNRLFASVAVLDARGVVRWASVPGLPPLDLARNPAFGRLRDDRSNRIAISAAEISRFVPRPLVSVSRAIRDANGTFRGAVVVRIPVERFVDFNQRAVTRPLDVISVIRLDGVTLARRTGARISYGDSVAGMLPMRQQLAHPDGTYIGPSAYSGIRRIFSHRRLAEYGIFVTSGIAERDVLAAEDGRVARVRGMTTAITLAIALFAGLAIHALLRRDKAARDLAGTNDRLHEAQRIGGIGDWEYDCAGDRLVLSDQLCRMYDRAPDDDMVGGRTALALLPREDRRRLLAAVRGAIAGKRPQSCDVVARTGRRHRSHRRIRIVPIVEADGSVRSLIGTDQDVSAEKAHAALREEVAHGARVQAMNIMAETIAHEIAQPLTAASNYIAAVQLGSAATAHQADLLGKARAQIVLAQGIMQRARDMAANRRSDGAARVAEAVDDALALLHASTPGCPATFAVKLDPEAAWVAADKVQVQQVLLNLLRNAVQAVRSHPAGHIVIASAAQPDGTVQLTVTDNGPGIGAPEEVFLPFVSSRPASGLGLGLSICRTIVESYGGRIHAEAGVARGARLCFTLPALAAPERAIEPA
ncbi:ATP-binding protein [Sphingomonas elodea]|uniref:ATP-binding protein n=1 Tax=Sphingomonas elodea TaxID=179878 RepID=UPI0002631366|nr:ATP-binding protein [Sphingomonas elodea]